MRWDDKMKNKTEQHIPFILKPVSLFFDYWRWYKGKKYVPDNKHTMLLDVGAGNGGFVRLFKRTHTTTTDKKRGINIQEKTPFKENTFDYVTMLAVLEHLIQPNKALTEVHRILKPRGTLIITTPHLRAERILKFWNGGHDHKRHFTRKDFEKVPGFALIRYEEFEFKHNQLIILQKEIIENDG